MLNRRHIVLLAVALIPALAFSAAPTVLVVSPDVSYVQTGGYWQLNGQGGQYRVVVATGGFEHVSTHIRFEWVSEPTPTGESRRIFRTVVLHESLLGVASVTAFKPDAQGVTVDLEGRTDDGAKYSCRVVLQPEGLKSKSAGCH